MDKGTVAGIEKLIDVVASGIGSIAGPTLAPWKARRERAASRTSVLFMGLAGADEVVAIACSVIEAANSKAYEKAKVNYLLHASMLYRFWSRGAGS